MNEEARLKRYGNARQVAADLFYLQTLIVNLCLAGKPRDEKGGSPPVWVLIDSGLDNMAGEILETAAALYGKDRPPQAVILTHGHFDHVGAAEELSRRWPVTFYAHQAELPYLTGKASYPPADPSVSSGLMAKLSPFYPRTPIDLGERVQPLPADGSVPSMSGWRWIATPGHTPGHVALFRESDRVLIAGDAFTTVKQESALAVMEQKREVHGPPAYFTINWDEARKSVEKLAALHPEVVITGHGQPMRGAELEEELQELSRDFREESIPDQGRYVEKPVPMENSGAEESPRF